MTARLVSYSTPVDPSCGNNLLEVVAYCARVSNPSNQHNNKTAEKLVQYLVKHKHWSPLEMVSVCMEIETTRDIARQLLRHRSFSFQEFSQRYAMPGDLGQMEEMRECRLQDTKNRQNSILCEDEELCKEWEEKQRLLLEHSSSLYSWGVSRGLAKEVCRVLLPEGLTLSRLYVNGTLRSWLHYLEVRSECGSQREHRLLSESVCSALSVVFPLARSFLAGDTPAPPKEGDKECEKEGVKEG